MGQAEEGSWMVLWMAVTLAKGAERKVPGRIFLFGSFVWEESEEKWVAVHSELTQMLKDFTLC